MSRRLQTEWEGDGPLAETAEPGATNPKKNIYIFFLQYVGYRVNQVYDIDNKTYLIR